MSLQILLREVLQISLGESDIRLHCHFLFVVGYSHGLTQVPGPASDFDALAEVLCEVGCVEDLILDWFAAIDGEAVRDLGLGGFLLCGFLFDFGLFGGCLGLGLFCGHGIINYYK